MARAELSPRSARSFLFLRRHRHQVRNHCRARRALLFIVRAFFNHAFAVAIWTSFHARLMSRSLVPARASDLRSQAPTSNSERCVPEPALREGRGHVRFTSHAARSVRGFSAAARAVNPPQTSHL